MKLVCYVFLFLTLIVPACVQIWKALMLSRIRYGKTEGILREFWIEIADSRSAGQISAGAYNPIVSYSFQVRGVDYAGSRLTMPVGGKGEKSPGTISIFQQKIGDPIDVFYDRTNPSECFLDDPLRLAAFRSALAFCCIAIFCLVAGMIYLM
ncbi:MAG: DUF3592 domain-containing protein [Verrucomicrobiota bacterium]